MDEQEKKGLPEEGDGKEHDVPLEGKETDEVGGSVREPAEGDEQDGNDAGQASEAGEASEGSEASRLRGIGYPSITELRGYLKRAYKHVSDGEVPVVVMITGKAAWYPITNVESIQNATDGSQAVMITLMPMPDDLPKAEPSIEVVKKMPEAPPPRRPEDAN